MFELEKSECEINFMDSILNIEEGYNVSEFDYIKKDYIENILDRDNYIDRIEYAKNYLKTLEDFIYNRKFEKIGDNKIRVHNLIKDTFKDIEIEEDEGFLTIKAIN
jgi:hypothetical protein